MIQEFHAIIDEEMGDWGGPERELLQSLCKRIHARIAALAVEQQKKWPEIMADAMKHIERAILDLQVVERDWKMDAAALQAKDTK